MLKKLLHYDFKAVMRYWLIGAISSVALSLVGGWCISIYASEKDLPEALYLVSTLLMVIVVLGIMAFLILTTVLVFSRFYKNFFTDEGYLTFTLPVKRSSLLNSKLIMSTGVNVLTALVIILDVIIMVAIGIPDLFFEKEFWNEIWDEFVLEAFKTLGGFAIAYFVELIAVFVLIMVFSTLFMFCCITFASIITKKAKVLTAIGIYYVANSVFTFVVQMFWLFGIEAIAGYIDDVSVRVQSAFYMLVLLGIILFIAIFCGMFYALEYWMLDRKLNLS